MWMMDEEIIDRKSMGERYRNIRQKTTSKVSLFEFRTKKKGTDPTIDNIIQHENELMQLMVEDICQWLSQLVGDTELTPQNFLVSLQDGVILCQLANTIQDYANSMAAKKRNSPFGKKFTFKSKHVCKNDKSKFQARENVSKFLEWCRSHNIPSTMLFESNDCVEGGRDGGRELIICLMNLARRFNAHYSIPVPEMIKVDLENELVTNRKPRRSHSSLTEKSSIFEPKSPQDSPNYRDTNRINNRTTTLTSRDEYFFCDDTLKEDDYELTTESKQLLKDLFDDDIFIKNSTVTTTTPTSMVTTKTTTINQSHLADDDNTFTTDSTATTINQSYLVDDDNKFTTDLTATTINQAHLIDDDNKFTTDLTATTINQAHLIDDDNKFAIDSAATTIDQPHFVNVDDGEKVFHHKLSIDEPKIKIETHFDSLFSDEDNIKIVDILDDPPIVSTYTTTTTTANNNDIYPLELLLDISSDKLDNNLEDRAINDLQRVLLDEDFIREKGPYCFDYHNNNQVDVCCRSNGHINKPECCHNNNIVYPCGHDIAGIDGNFYCCRAQKLALKGIEQFSCDHGDYDICCMDKNQFKPCGHNITTIEDLCCYNTNIHNCVDECYGHKTCCCMRFYEGECEHYITKNISNESPIKCCRYLFYQNYITQDPTIEDCNIIGYKTCPTHMNESMDQLGRHHHHHPRYQKSFQDNDDNIDNEIDHQLQNVINQLMKMKNYSKKFKFEFIGVSINGRLLFIKNINQQLMIRCKYGWCPLDDFIIKLSNMNESSPTKNPATPTYHNPYHHIRSRSNSKDMNNLKHSSEFNNRIIE